MRINQALRSVLIAAPKDMTGMPYIASIAERNCKNELVTYCDDAQSTYETTSTETLQKDYEGAWGMNINWPKNPPWMHILDVATITNKERQKCAKIRSGEGF